VGQAWNVVEWQNRTAQSISRYSSREDAVKASYQVFVRGEGYPEAILLHDQDSSWVSIRIDDEDDQREGAQAGDYPENLSSVWDAWLKLHPEERADWDVGPRQPRLQLLKGQHVPAVRMFSSEHVIANPDWYRRLYGALGMTDEMFDTLLGLHRFALAEKEAQRLAAEQKGSVPPHARRVAAIYLEQYLEHPGDPEQTSVPLETQERACRAYCQRVGYKVHGVYCATTPPPNDVPLREEIGIRPGHAFVYYRRDSMHPYHVVNNLLEARTIDVKVEFVQDGPSRRLYGDVLASDSGNLLSVELASLWEIEPPTEDERQLYEVLTRIGQGGLEASEEAEAERTALLEQLTVLSQRVNKAGRRTATSASAPPRAVAAAQAVKPTICYACQVRPAREGSAFCSDTCAQAAAERLVQTTTRGWCSACGGWIGGDGCPHSR
jgi:hypothetical protein